MGMGSELVNECFEPCLRASARKCSVTLMFVLLLLSPDQVYNVPQTLQEYTEAKKLHKRGKGFHVRLPRSSTFLCDSAELAAHQEKIESS
jgi:hypothetical protein